MSLEYTPHSGYHVNDLPFRHACLCLPVYLFRRFGFGWSAYLSLMYRGYESSRGGYGCIQKGPWVCVFIRIWEYPFGVHVFFRSSSPKNGIWMIRLEALLGIFGVWFSLRVCNEALPFAQSVTKRITIPASSSVAAMDNSSLAN
jgi:hypothetical protein